jgi:hypothetical protein
LACASEGTNLGPDAQVVVVPSDDSGLPVRGNGQPDVAEEAGATAPIDASIGDDAESSHDVASPPVDAASSPDATSDGAGLSCDPVSNLGCADTLKCAVNNTAGSFIRCQGFGTQTVREQCTYTTTGDTCAPGLSCFAVATEPKPTCRRLCPWAARGTRVEVCAYAPRGLCLPLITTYKVAYCD